MLAISGSDIAQILDWPEAVQAIEQGFAALAMGYADVPLRIGLPIPAHAGLLPQLLYPNSEHLPIVF